MLAERNAPRASTSLLAKMAHGGRGPPHYSPIASRLPVIEWSGACADHAGFDASPDYQRGQVAGKLRVVRYCGVTSAPIGGGRVDQVPRRVTGAGISSIPTSRSLSRLRPEKPP